ncbi:hypothetical protein JCM8547_007230 [Rhodosporidiobolus lusitaniae]
MLLSSAARRPQPPLYSEIRRFFVTLHRAPVGRPELAVGGAALARAWSACPGVARPRDGLFGGTSTSRWREAGGERERWVGLRQSLAKRYSTCPTPNCPSNQQTRRATTSSPLDSSSSPPPSSAAPSSSSSATASSSSSPAHPSHPSPTSPFHDPHALAKPEPHPLAKLEPHPLARTPSPAYLSSLPRYLRRAASSLPSAPGRPPPKDQLLSLTNSFFERLKIRFKWATIRSYRRFRADDYTAFFSFGILGTLGWFLLSTTSAFAVLFFVVNSLSLQEWLAGKLGAYLTQATGMRVVFESAVVPKWGILGGGGSKIVFKNVYISRGPVKGELGVLPILDEEKGEQKEETEEEARMREMVAEWTHFHLSIATVEVSLSLSRWLDGKGLIKDAAVRGVRGVVERSHIVYDPDAPKDRFAYRNKPRPGDFWLESLQIEDFLVTIYQPEHFRPYTFSIFNADIRRLRKQWLFYDLMSAESITGQCDNCLFSLHKPQSIGRTSEEDLKDARWSRMSRFRVDGVPIDHMQSSSDTGVMSWLTSGRFDLVADIRFPREEGDGLDLSALVDHLVDEIGERLSASAKEDSSMRIPGRQALSRDALEAPRKGKEEKVRGEDGERAKEERKKAIRFAKETDASASGVELDEEELREAVESAVLVQGEDEEDKIVSIDLDVRFKDLKATVPYFTSDLSYVNNALIRPIVAFINRNRTLVPIRCHIDLGLSEFNGSWTTYDVGILDRMSEQVYAALAHHVQHSNDQRMQTVGWWTLQTTSASLLSTIRHNLTLAPY